MFLKLGSAESQEAAKDIKGSGSENRKGARVLMQVLNSCVGMKIRVATFEANHSVTDSTQSIAASIHMLADTVVKSFIKIK